MIVCGEKRCVLIKTGICFAQFLVLKKRGRDYLKRTKWINLQKTCKNSARNFHILKGQFQKPL